MEHNHKLCYFHDEVHGFRIARLSERAKLAQHHAPSVNPKMRATNGHAHALAKIETGSGSQRLHHPKKQMTTTQNALTTSTPETKCHHPRDTSVLFWFGQQLDPHKDLLTENNTRALHGFFCGWLLAAPIGSPAGLCLPTCTLQFPHAKFRSCRQVLPARGADTTFRNHLPTTTIREGDTLQTTISNITHHP